MPFMLLPKYIGWFCWLWWCCCWISSCGCIFFVDVPVVIVVIVSVVEVAVAAAAVVVVQTVMFFAIKLHVCWNPHLGNLCMSWVIERIFAFIGWGPESALDRAMRVGCVTLLLQAQWAAALWLAKNETFGVLCRRNHNLNLHESVFWKGHYIHSC